jgi:hypothetical protein
MSLPSDGSAEVIALLVVGALGFVMRWVFKPARKRPVTRPVNAAESQELGLLTVVATVPRTQAQARRAQLGEVGIRSSASRRTDGNFDVLVFHADADQARQVLED